MGWQGHPGGEAFLTRSSLLIHAVSNVLFSTYYVPGMVLGNGDSMWKDAEFLQSWSSGTRCN